MTAIQSVFNLKKVLHTAKPGFLRRYEEALCVYSNPVNQLYANYSLWPGGADGAFTVMPNIHAYHDIFQNIDKDAITRTNIYIIPGESVQKTGLYLAQRNKDSKSLEVTPFSEGLANLKRRKEKGRPCLPVIDGDDLQNLDLRMPYIPLCLLDFSKLKSKSPFEQKDLTRTIEKKLALYLQTERAQSLALMPE